MIRADASTATPVPWKNGGGVTRELLRLPAGSGDDWTLRISVADIAADGLVLAASPGIRALVRRADRRRRAPGLP